MSFDWTRLGRAFMFAEQRQSWRHTLRTRASMPLLQSLRLFVASPGDVQREREHVATLADELNRTTAHDAGFSIQVVRWETDTRPAIGRPQQVIFDQVGEVDLFVGIMWQRFGAPTGNAESGTEEEFNAALASWEREQRPRILCYFSRAPIEPPASVEAAEQLLKVAKFRARLHGLGLMGSYTSDAEFKDLLRVHLQDVIRREFSGRIPPLAQPVLTLLNLEKDACRDRGIAFHTPHLLLALLREKGVRTAFDQMFGQRVSSLIEHLRNYRPPDQWEDTHPSGRIDWYQRADVQAARRRAAAEESNTITARHLLLGFLDTQGATRAALRERLGADDLEQLRQLIEYGSRVGTPGIEDHMRARKPAPLQQEDRGEPHD